MSKRKDEQWLDMGSFAKRVGCRVERKLKGRRGFYVYDQAGLVFMSRRMDVVSGYLVGVFHEQQKSRQLEQAAQRLSEGD